jgi:protein SDA1
MTVCTLWLLNDHLKTIRGENKAFGKEEPDDEEAREGRQAESESSDDSSNSGGWIDVESHGEDRLGISDGEDEKREEVPENDSPTTDPNRTSKLPTTKVRYAHLLIKGRPRTQFCSQILTPADFALINDLQIQAVTTAVESGGCTATQHNLAPLEAAKKAKTGYEEPIASRARGRESREKFGSLKGRRKEAASNLTNREKARSKPIMMIVGSKGVVGMKQSLRKKQKRLHAHTRAGRAKNAHH